MRLGRGCQPGGRRRTWIVLAVVSALLVAGAHVRDGRTTRRAVAPLGGQEAVLVSPAELTVSVPSCNGDPVVDRLDENPHQVALRVTTTVATGGLQNLCVDGVRVVLREPLGDRPVIDLHSGDVLPVVRFGRVAPGG